MRYITPLCRYAPVPRFSLIFCLTAYLLSASLQSPSHARLVLRGGFCEGGGRGGVECHSGLDSVPVHCFSLLCSYGGVARGGGFGIDVGMGDGGSRW